jgi:hypothetical protein
MIDAETILIDVTDTVVIYEYLGRLLVTVGQMCSGDEDECTHTDSDKPHLKFKSCDFMSLQLDDDETKIHHIQTNTEVKDNA